jgi:hypothetical protein
MTPAGPAAQPGTAQQAVVEAALLVLERMGLPPEDLAAAPRSRPVVPTFAEYIPVVSAAVTAGTRRAYGSYWNRVTEHWGSRRLYEPTPSEIRQLMTHVKTHVVARRNARVGRSAQEHLVAALRCVYRHAEDDQLISADQNPARKVAKPRRLPSTRRAVPDTRLAEINQVAAATGNDPELDTLLLRLHTETACRRGGALAAAAEVWSGWVGIARMTGFGLVSPLPGIWPSLHLDTAITLPVGVEAYAAYALRAWLSSGHAASTRTRRFAKWSAIFSFALGMAGQVAYHLLAQAGQTRAPWPITMIVSCLPVLVLAMGTTLAHMLHADTTTSQPDHQTGEPAMRHPDERPPGDRTGPDQDHNPADTTPGLAGPPDQTTTPSRDQRGIIRTTAGTPAPARPEIERARLVTRRLAAAGQPVSRRALRNAGITGSNEALNALARNMKNELAGTAGSPRHT